MATLVHGSGYGMGGGGYGGGGGGGGGYGGGPIPLAVRSNHNIRTYDVPSYGSSKPVYVNGISLFLLIWFDFNHLNFSILKYSWFKFTTNIYEFPIKIINVEY